MFHSRIVEIFDRNYYEVFEKDLVIRELIEIGRVFRATKRSLKMTFSFLL